MKITAEKRWPAQDSKHKKKFSEIIITIILTPHMFCCLKIPVMELWEKINVQATKLNFLGDKRIPKESKDGGGGGVHFYILNKMSFPMAWRIILAHCEVIYRKYLEFTEQRWAMKIVFHCCLSRKEILFLFFFVK